MAHLRPGNLIENHTSEPRPYGFVSGGVRCQGWLYAPPGDPPYACVVMAHGFGAAPGGLLGRVAARFAESGFAAFAFDYRGFGASEGTPRQLLNIDNQLDDWLAAIGFVRDLDEVDPERVGLWGSSLSGGQVIAVAALQPSVRAAVAQVPYCDGPALARAAGLRHNLRVAPAVLRDLVQFKLTGRSYCIDALGPPGARALMNTRFPHLFAQVSGGAGDGWSNRVAARSLVSLYRFRPGLLAKQVRCPLLVVLTYRDRVAPADTAIRAARGLPYVEMALFSARHFDFYADADACTRALKTEASFLAHHLNGRQPLAAAA